MGRAITKEKIRPKSPPIISSIAITNEIQRQRAKIIHIPNEGGVSITESSRTKKRFIFVGIGVCIDPPSGIGCARMPFSSDVNNLTSISLGRCKKIKKPIHGKVTKLHPITYSGSPLRIPISWAEKA